MQPVFNFRSLLGALMLAAPVLALHAWAREQPTRVERPDRAVVGTATMLPPGRIAGSLPMRRWRLIAPDPRLGGISGLALDGRSLVAVTDEGAVIRFDPPRPGRSAVRFAFHDLPDGPGPATSKRGRDAEALVAARGGGWWVAFEGRHSVWRYDQAFTRVLSKVRLSTDWPSNTGGEAMLQARDGALLLLPEGGGKAVVVGGSKERVSRRGTSDATMLPDGRVVVLDRRMTPAGFRSTVRIDSGAGRPATTLVLPLAPLDNPEAIAAAPLADGGTRLWIVTDDNFRPWMRTLLVAIDLPGGSAAP